MGGEQKKEERRGKGKGAINWRAADVADSDPEPNFDCDSGKPLVQRVNSIAQLAYVCVHVCVSVCICVCACVNVSPFSGRHFAG